MAPAACVALLSVAGFLVACAGMGWRLQVVRTGSMEPAYPVGALTLVTPADPGSLPAGSSIVFAAGGDADRLVSHRVVRRVERPDGLYFETKGDANTAADPTLVAARDVRGTVRLSLPRVGGLLQAATSAPVALLVILVGVAGLVAGELRRGGGRSGRRLRDPSLLS